MQSAPIPATGLPASTVTPKELAIEEKEQPSPMAEVTAASSALEYVDEQEPTDEEYSTLRKVPGKIKWVTIAMCLIELAERASYYGCSGVVKNFVNRPLPKGGNGAGAVAPGAEGENQTAGALGKGSVKASAVYNAFIFLAYVIPIFGGIVADTKWGRFKTISVGVAIGFVAHVLMVISAIPKVLSGGHAIGPFLLSLYILSFAAGFIKPCLATLMCDQSPVKKPTVQTLPSGEKVILDPQTTIQRYLLIFYWCINVGGFFAIASAYSARFVGFWLAYLLPGIVYMLMPVVLALCYKKLYKAPPSGSVTLEAMRVFKVCLGNGGWKRFWKGGDDFWSRAKPSYIEANGGIVNGSKITWDDLFVDEIRQSFAACGVFFLIPIFILADGGIGAQESAMSASMTLNNAPNDIIDNFNPLTIIVATPIMTYIVYPWFERRGWPLKPMTRMSIGFMLGTLNMIWGAVLQWRVYKTSPCGYQASTCEDGVSPITIWAQIPLYALPAIGEIFVMVTSMKGFVYALCLFNQAISSAIGLACSNAIQDPYLIWPYVALAIACTICAAIFPIYFKHLDEPMKEFADPARQAGAQQQSALGGAHEEAAHSEKV
ncbi:POT family proton-dependent oligopeptide transporter [Kwoniella heveanensis CBS 569]|nr:POT family proton-dependent oligopeptide transporter [Kwoniella heveanensis CBS 569]